MKTCLFSNFKRGLTEENIFSTVHTIQGDVHKINISDKGFLGYENMEIQQFISSQKEVVVV